MSFNKNKSGGIMSGSIGIGFAEIDITTEEKFGINWSETIHKCFIG